MIRTLALALVVVSLLCIPAVGQQAPSGGQQFLVRLEPVRTDFSLMKLTDQEQVLAMQHMLYLKTLQMEGKLTFAGQAFDPKGFWGFYIVNAPDAQAANALLTADPAIKGSLLKGEAIPFRTVLEKTVAAASAPAKPKPAAE